MFAKAVAISALLAIAHAGAPAVVQYAQPSVGVGGSNTVRGLAGISSVTHQAKAVDSPFSTVRKTDTRVTNDAVAYASPVAQQVVQYAQPGVQYAQQPVVQYSQPPQAVQYTQAPQAVQYAQAPQAVQYAQAPQAVQYAQAPQAVQYAQAPQAVQYTQAPVQYAQQPVVQYAQAPQAVQYAAAPVQYAQQTVAAVSGPQQFYNYAPALAYGTKTISGAPVAVQSVAKVAAAPVAYAAPTLQYHQPTVYAQQAVTKVAAPVAYATPVAKVGTLARGVPVAKTSLLGVNFSPINEKTASLHFNGFGTSYTLF